ncbi:MAG: HPF/RaiA family ribosome-associated protein, partial [Cyanobacteria bacterium SZAS LIN-2]|nr:HPF/RaiA family ribosome-associated protein [Cyanobacteria bacterium SZAS LIN-2]
MKLPAQVVFKNMERSEWIEEQVLGYANKLDQFCGQIMSCRVTIDMPHKHQVKAKCYHVTVDVTVPGEEIVVNKEDGAH